VRLADPAVRGSLFDDEALGAVARAGYDQPELEGPFSAVFDGVDLAVAVPSTITASGELYLTPGATPAQLRMAFTGPADPGAARLTAVWRGSVVARVRPAADPLDRLAIRWPRLGDVDAAVVAATGALPADPGALETARRTQLLALLADTAGGPVLGGDAELQRWLQATGAATVGQLLVGLDENGGAAYVRVGFADPAAVPARPRPLPVTVALLARDAGFSIAGLLADTASVRARLSDVAGGGPEPPDLRRRTDVVVGWVVPGTTFDDAGWPGGDTGSAAERRSARRSAATTWLAGHGIALIATSFA